MQIWLKSGSKKVQIPVLPSEYQVSSSQKNKTVDVIGIGEVTLRGKKGLRTVKFSSFFPKVYDASYCSTRPWNPKKYVDQIEKMKKSGPVKLTMTGTSVNFKVTIESFDWGEKDGTGDIFYTLTMKEYVGIPSSKSSVIAEV